MTSTPPPPPGSEDAAAGDAEAWRSTVLQSSRNAEVREIAKILASLEPGASQSSKLMLAMRFEDTIFKAATSFADYRKKITKRLKKLQKNYVPPTEPATKHSKVDQLLAELAHQYGDSLRYIYKYASRAIKEIRLRLGPERAIQLQQHTDSACQWALDLGVVKSTDGKASHVPPIHWTEEKVAKLQQHLERRVDNIRSYVVKHADPDLFLQETLERKDKELPVRAARLLGLNIAKRLEQLQGGKPFDALKIVQESLEKAQVTVPPPTRNNANDVPAALLHLDKMRNASTALLAYLASTDRTTVPRSTVVKAHTVATQGIEFVKQVSKKQQDLQTNKGEVTLQDAWSKALELHDEEVDVDTNTNERGAALPGNAKRLKLHHLPPTYKSRVLLTPKRKTPSNILPALKRKRAKLVRPPPDGTGSHIILEFGTAFTMTIYFCPLLVTIRAMEPPILEATKSTDADGNKQRDKNKGSGSGNSNNLTVVGCADWTPLDHGLPDRNDLEVWGVSGTYDSIGHVIEERLRDASTHATNVLRKCFRNSVKDKTMEFEIEILEATALLEFLQVARRTYMPNWQDDDP